MAIQQASTDCTRLWPPQTTGSVRPGNGENSSCTHTYCTVCQKHSVVYVCMYAHMKKQHIPIVSRANLCKWIWLTFRAFLCHMSDMSLHMHPRGLQGGRLCRHLNCLHTMSLNTDACRCWVSGTHGYTWNLGFVKWNCRSIQIPFGTRLKPSSLPVSTITPFTAICHLKSKWSRERKS